VNSSTYELVAGAGDADNALFTVDPDGKLRAATIFDYEATFDPENDYQQRVFYTRVRSTDSVGLFTETYFIIEIANADEPPTGVTLDGVTLDNVSVSEDAPLLRSWNATLVGTFRAIDQDFWGYHDYALVSGEGDDDNGSFFLFGWLLMKPGGFDFETQSSYAIRIRVSDQVGFFEQGFVIHVTDVNEAPTDIALSNDTVAANRPAGTVVGTLSTVDQDTADSHTYMLISGNGDDNNAAFAIEGNELKTAAGFTFNPGSSYSIRVRTIDAGGLFFDRVFVIHATHGNVAPTVTINGAPDSGSEGDAIQLTASVSDPDRADTLTLVWAVTKNGNPYANGWGTTISFTPDDDGSYVVTVTVTDDDGGVGSDVKTIAIHNASPTVTSFVATSGVDAAGRGVHLHPISFSVTATDPSLADTFMYQVDWDGDGTWDEQTAPGQGGVLTLSHVYETAGTFTPMVRVLDDDGGASTPRPLSAPLSIHPAALIGGNLVVGGTAAADFLRVTQTRPNQFRVVGPAGWIPNPTGGTTFALGAAGRIILYGGSGNDTLIANVTVPVEAHGGSGDDRLLGGNSHDVLWGDEGVDLLFGRNGNDVLIGGLGGDFLFGGNGDDLLFGGALRGGPAHHGVEPYDYAALREISAAWAAGAADLDLDSGLSDDLDDTERDNLLGGAGREWFLGNLDGTNADLILPYLAQFEKKSSLM
jgi:Ca2+-binding RTX toxin-like protein